MPTEKTGTYTFLVPQVGPPGSTSWSSSGVGPGGDVVTTFAWTTSAQGFMPEPDGYLGIVGGSPGERFGYAPELSLNDLARTPAKASALITVTAGNGESVTLPALSPERNCSGEGTIYFSGDDALGAQVVDLGPPPYTYSVEVTLDGKTHTGTGTWPTDEIEGNEPYVALDWSPPAPRVDRRLTRAARYRRAGVETWQTPATRARARGGRRWPSWAPPSWSAPSCWASPRSVRPPAGPTSRTRAAGRIPQAS